MAATIGVVADDGEVATTEVIGATVDVVAGGRVRDALAGADADVGRSVRSNPSVAPRPNGNQAAANPSATSALAMPMIGRARGVLLGRVTVLSKGVPVDRRSAGPMATSLSGSVDASRSDMLERGRR